MEKPVLYLDNAATSWPKPQAVLDEMRRFLVEDGGSPNRAGHRMCLAAERVVRDVRRKLARLLNVGDPDRIIHCFNCSDALNMAIKGVLSEGDHVITTELDHNSVLRPLQAMADAGVISVTRLTAGSSQAVDPDDVRRAITPNTKLIATLHASNVTGAIQPVAELGRIARAHDVLLLIDAAQSVGLLDIDVEAARIDLLAVPGHKALLGPTGTGALYVGSRATLRPFREGGTGGDSAHPTQPTEYPTWLEAGTPNAVGLAGLSVALDGLQPRDALKHERQLLDYLAQAVADDDRLRIAGPPPSEHTVGVVSLLVPGQAPADVGAILDEAFGIAVRPGVHCAPHLHRAMGTLPDGTVRIAPGPTTTLDDMDRLTVALRQVAEQ